MIVRICRVNIITISYGLSKICKRKRRYRGYIHTYTPYIPSGTPTVYLHTLTVRTVSCENRIENARWSCTERVAPSPRLGPRCNPHGALRAARDSREQTMKKLERLCREVCLLVMGQASKTHTSGFSTVDRTSLIRT